MGILYKAYPLSDLAIINYGMRDIPATKALLEYLSN